MVKSEKLFNLEINGKSRLINSAESLGWESFYEEYYSSNIALRVSLVERQYANPYYQNASFACWAIGSDWYEDHRPFLIWAFFGWIEITDEETVANWIYERE